MAAQQEAAIEELSTILAENLAELDAESDVASDVDRERGKTTTEDDFDPEEPLDSDEEQHVPAKCIPKQLL